jgi:hypothetical protein
LQSISKLDGQFKGLFGEPIESSEDEPIRVRESGKRFMDTYGWIYQAAIVAEHEKVKLDEVYDMPVLQFLNDLAYLKAKQDYEQQQIKNLK